MKKIFLKIVIGVVLVCIFVPADSEVLTIHGQAQFLDVRG